MYYNSDKFDQLLFLAAIRSADEESRELKALDVSGVKFDTSYYRKKSKTINRCKRAPTVRLTKMIAIRVAAVLMIMISLTCVLIGCVPEWREAIFNAIVEWYDGCFAVRYESYEVRQGEIRTLGSVAKGTKAVGAIVPEYIEAIRKPRDLPKGVREDILTASQTAVNIDYYLNGDCLFSFSQFILKPTNKYIDNVEGTIRQLTVNGNNAVAVEYSNKDEAYVIWNDGEYSYQIFSTKCDIETLIGYAEGVK